jgi:crotonobetainyl-CoA:carnitine CoA-transferase CaiB-like acyl-CoA transferase
VVAVGESWPALADELAAESWLPLAGVRVLDLSRILAGPFASMVLADLGADVIKVERPGVGDDTRRWGPPFHGADAAYFLSVNRSRRSLALDLEDPEGFEILARLARSADLVIENFLPAQLERLGLSRLREENPQLRWVSIRSAGSEGPLASRPGFDAMVQARSGLMSITGHDQPTKIGVALADVITGLYAAIAALALLRSDLAEAEVPLFECALAALVNQAANHLVGGITPGLHGNEHPNLVPYGSFACADGEIVVGAGTDRQFTALCSVLGRPELAGDERFVSNDVRIANRHALNAAIDEALRGRTVADWAERLDGAGVPWAPINDVAAAFAEAHVRAVGLVELVETPDGPLPQVRSPITLGGRRLPVRFAPPGLGSDNIAILDELGSA